MKKDISVVILNWNGSAMLQRFLPSVIRYSEEAEIIVAEAKARAVREVESTKKEAEELRMEIEQLKQLRTNYFIRCRALIKGQEELLSAMENDQRMQEELRRPAAPVAGNVLA